MNTALRSSILLPLLGLSLALGRFVFADDKTSDPAAKRDAELLAASKNPAIVKTGKATYVSLCQSCHADEKAKGDSPTNLFDAKWYHGGRPSEIEHTILQGVIEKNMPGWGAVLPPEDTMALTAFLLSFQKE